MGQEKDEGNKPEALVKELTTDKPGCCDSIWACLLNDYLDDDLLLLSALEGNGKGKVLVEEDRPTKVTEKGDETENDADKTKSKSRKKKKKKSRKAVSDFPEEPSLKGIADEPDPTFVSNNTVPLSASNLALNPSGSNVIIYPPSADKGDKYQPNPTETFAVVKDPVDERFTEPNSTEREPDIDARPKIKRTRSKAKERQMPELLVVPSAVSIQEQKVSIPFDVAVPHSPSVHSSRTRRALEPEDDTEAETPVDSGLKKPRSSRARRQAAIEELELLKAQIASKRAQSNGGVDKKKEKRSPEGSRLHEPDEKSMVSRKSSRPQRHSDINELDLREPAIVRDPYVYGDPTRSKINAELDIAYSYGEVSRKKSDIEKSSRSRSSRLHPQDPPRSGLRREADPAGERVGTSDRPIEIPSMSSDHYDSNMTTYPSRSSRRDDRDLESVLTGDRKHSRRETQSKSSSRGIDEEQLRMYSEELNRDRETRRLDRRAALLRIRAIKTRIANS